MIKDMFIFWLIMITIATTVFIVGAVHWAVYP
jgi:hypothetical protein